jgi:Polyketide cyclase / dehydrase and lipid transport
MKIVVVILISVVSLIALLLIIAFFIKKEYVIEREITINKSSGEVYSYIRFLRNQEHYSKWVMADPYMKKEFSGTDGTTGFVYAWDSENKNVGKGEQEIVKLVEGERVDAEIRFIRPFEGIATTSMTTEAMSPDITRVVWGMQGASKYPMNIMDPFMDNLLGKDLQSSLNQLKNILEK